jgi:hypothetical protein
MNYWNVGLLFIFIILNGATSVFSDVAIDETKDNLALLTQLTDSVAQEIVTKFPADTDSNVILISEREQTKATWFFENRLIQMLTSHHFRITTNQAPLARSGESGVANATENPTPASIQAGIRLEYQVQQLQIHYQGTRGVFQRSGVRRYADIIVAVKMTIYREQQQTLAETFVKHYHDELPYGMLNVIELPSLDFTQAPKPGSINFRDILDFLLIVGATGAVIYSFYIFRSN